MGQRRDLVEAKRDEICAIVHRHRGRSVSVFGSVARGDESPASDIDFLVEFEPGSSLFDLLHISEELEALLGVPVDVVSAGGLKERDDHIRREAVLL
ncbi:nucleotidyltransferase family protein [Candidatus Neomicrothrix sp.]|jgi:predicted nucleotidyltransferase|uniref:nucleotidyltransferase family protein n=1 Tax=Candidatus Neomicrothrix sp. TaxID=2719034 RepID=UPI001B45002E|nr:nucleotidyltransferase family protein [Candidatus Microthrix sp.]MBP7629645.1 nucleotidyltransferase family protein [Acidimicrobiales bacterium]HMS49798.1 nucleotidyltransferase family protein [Candidatus Microthrix sp.]